MPVSGSSLCLRCMPSVLSPELIWVLRSEYKMMLKVRISCFWEPAVGGPHCTLSERVLQLGITVRFDAAIFE